MIKSRRKNRGTLLGVVLLWGVGIATGSWLMLEHEFSSGALYHAPESLPEALQAHRQAGLPYLLVLSVHPECSCTRATIEQLDRLLAQNPGTIQTIALVSSSYSIKGSLASKDDTYRESLQALPNTKLISDPDAQLAKQLGATLSGSIALYDPNNRLSFQGGITISRGHSGDGVAFKELSRITRSLEPLELCSSPVFGCSLESPES